MSHADKLAEALEELIDWCVNWDAAFLDDPEFDIETFKKALADYNASKVGDDELVERLGFVREFVKDRTDFNSDPSGLFVSDIYEAITRLQSHPTTKD